MIFHFLLIDTKQIKKRVEHTIPLGSNICGLLLSGHKPQSVTLDRTELAEALSNKEFAVTLLSSLGDSK